MKKIVITGGAGFIGSHIVDHFFAKYPDSEICILDKMTYAADIRNITPLIEESRVRLVEEDICNLDVCFETLEGADLLIHAAAESHVDNSFGNSMAFTQTNVMGTHTLMEACRRHNTPKIIHVSTDEVYGEVLEGEAKEDSQLYPTNPYSASKAGAEMIISGYIRSFKLPVTVVRANNIFGIRQFPEKIIPKFLMLLMQGEKLTIHGNGRNKRHYLAAPDFAAALSLIAERWKPYEVYNIGTKEEYTNLEVATMLCQQFGLELDDCATFVEDRPFNDGRYAINWDHITELGWKPTLRLDQELPKVAKWYTDNFSRYEPKAPQKRVPVTNDENSNVSYL